MSDRIVAATRKGLFTATAAMETYPSYTQVDLRAGFKHDRWQGNLFAATAGYAHDWFDTRRALVVGTASQKHGGDEATAAAQCSRPIAVPGIGGRATVTPKAGVQFVHLSENRFAEGGAGGFSLSSADRDTNSFQPYIGVVAAGTITVLSGLAIWKPGQFQELTFLFGGFDVARVVHFFGMAAIVLFLIVHVALVVIVPKTLPAMITGRAAAHEVEESPR